MGSGLGSGIGQRESSWQNHRQDGHGRKTRGTENPQIIQFGKISTDYTLTIHLHDALAAVRFRTIRRRKGELTKISTANAILTTSTGVARRPRQQTRCCSDVSAQACGHRLHQKKDAERWKEE